MCVIVVGAAFGCFVAAMNDTVTVVVFAVPGTIACYYKLLYRFAVVVAVVVVVVVAVVAAAAAAAAVVVAVLLLLFFFFF